MWVECLISAEAILSYFPRDPMIVLEKASEGPEKEDPRGGRAHLSSVHMPSAGAKAKWSGDAED
jgi:hypothetical protein